jgi:hypothetical protein
MSWELVLQMVQTAAVVFGIGFGLVQLREFRRQKEAQAGIELLHSLQLPQTPVSVLLLHGLPDNLTGEELQSKLGSRFDSVIALLAVFESLGPLVARGHVPIEMYEQFYRGATIVCWRKTRRYVEEQREGWPGLFEWVQWLAERMEERPSPPRPDVATS